MAIEVADTGIGIKETDRQKLFADFERLDVVRNRRIEGTGLGMAITAKLAKLMRGSIDFTSVYGQGTTFTVRLPQKIVSRVPIGDFTAELAPAEEADAYRASFRAPRAKILLVDDNEINLLVAQNLLKETQMQIDTCLGGEECLEKMRQERYHVILLDHMMPDMDGVETLQKSLTLPGSKCQGTPVIALTANAITGVREKFLAAGFSDYLSKPIVPAKLEQTIKKFLPPEFLLEGEESRPPNSAAVPVVVEEKGTPPLIDRRLGLRYNGGMTDMYHMVLTMFADSQGEKAAKMNNALADEDWRSYSVLTHGLKSTALTIGSKELSEAAKALEAAGKKLKDAAGEPESLSYIKENHRRVMNLYELVAQEARREKVRTEGETSGAFC